MCLLISLFSREILMLFAQKEAFWAAWVIVPIITYSYVQHGIGNFIGWGMGLMKKSFHVSGIVLVAALVNIGLNFLFVPNGVCWELHSPLWYPTLCGIC